MRVALALCVALWGCTAARETVVLEPPDLACLPDPAVPAVADPVAVALYMIDVRLAGQTCRDAVADYREWREFIQRYRD